MFLGQVLERQQHPTATLDTLIETANIIATDEKPTTSADFMAICTERLAASQNAKSFFPVSYK
jgi:hypothetical protein